MNTEGWIKLHRKMLLNDVYRYDPTAWRIFFYMLLSCDHKTGTLKCAHSTMIKFLGIPKATLSRAIDRLKTEQMLNYERNPNYTLYTICNWHKYQVHTEQSTEPKRNQNGTKTEHIQEERIKNKDIKKEINKEKKFSTVAEITEDVVADIAETYEVRVQSVRSELESLKLYCESTGKKYANYKAALMNWVRRKIDEGKILKVSKSQPLPIPDREDYVPASPEAIAKFRKQSAEISKKTSMRTAIQSQNKAT